MSIPRPPTTTDHVSPDLFSVGNPAERAPKQADPKQKLGSSTHFCSRFEPRANLPPVAEQAPDQGAKMSKAADEGGRLQCHECESSFL